MERLLTSAEFKEPPRNFYLISVDSISEIPSRISPTSRNFGLFIAMDAVEVDADVIHAVATSLIQRGLAYVCCWGPDCEIVHDMFDLAEVDLGIAGELKHPDPHDGVMSSWHEHDSLQRAVWFFGKFAWPTGSFELTTHDWFAVSVGNPEWAEIIREEITSGFPSYK